MRSTKREIALLDLKRHKWPLLMSVAYLAQLFFLVQIERHSPWPLYYLFYAIIACMFVWMSSSIAKTIAVFLFSGFKNVEHIKRAGIYLVAVAIPIIAPFQFSTLVFEPEPEIRACYEGTQNQATAIFRSNGRFEINATGIFMYNKWWMGNWKKHQDTIQLQYDQDEYGKFGQTLVIKDSLLFPYKRLSDSSLNRFTLFYLGYCKGLN